jgi:IclR family acetate operon transcriptional repressor
VFCYTGQVFASMCVLGPKHRMTHQKLQAARTALAALSGKLSQRLGYSAA